MQTAPNNKARHGREQRATHYHGETGRAEELVRCAGCHVLVAVPYGGQVTCACRHETFWHSRYTTRKHSSPICPESDLHR